MSRQKIIDIAASQLGTKETPPGSNKNPYGKWYGFDGYAWCAMFVSWVYDKAGHPLGFVDDAKGYRGCQSGYNHWNATGETTREPEKGDIVLFDWTGDKHCDHTGIFVEWLDTAKTRFRSYEGNTAVGNDSDGGEVMLRERKVASVKTFVKPKVLQSKAQAMVPANAIVKPGDRSADVASIQKHLFDLGYKISVDGVFGSGTEKAVREFQKDNKLPSTGLITPALAGMIESKLTTPKVPAAKLTTGAFLKKGDSGGAVVDLQKALNKAGAKPKLAEDGVYGPGTEKAVKDFQKAKKLTVDGVAGPQTIAALKIK